jgi:hypothetical protein
MAGSIDVIGERCRQCFRRLYLLPPSVDRHCKGCDETESSCYCPPVPQPEPA